MVVQKSLSPKKQKGDTMARTAKNPSHLLRVGTCYHFRYNLPKAFPGEIRLSLKTGSLKKARLLSAKLKNEAAKLIERNNYMAISKAEIRAALNTYLQKEIEDIEIHRIDGVEPFRTQETCSPEGLLNLFSVSIRDSLSYREGMDQFTIDRCSEFLKSSGMANVVDEEHLFKYACRELLKTEQTLIEIQKQRIKGIYNSPAEQALSVGFVNSNTQTKASQPIKKENPKTSHFIDQYLSENISDESWKASTLKEYSNHLAMFLETMGDNPLNQMDYEKTRIFFDIIKKLPANRKKVKRYRDKSIPQLLKIKIPEKDLITAKTINNIMVSLSAFYNWAVTRGYMSQNFAQSMRIKSTKQASKLKDAFSDGEIVQIFNTLHEYKIDMQSNHRFWIPMIALYSGARLEEIAQLHTGDVKKVEGIWCIDINDDGDKKLKNINSRRIVPVHQALITAGFLDFHATALKSKFKQLFAHLKPMTGKYGHYISRWFGPLLTNLKIKTASHNVSFHSFRHTFITRAKHVDLPEGYVKQLVGHAAGSITFGTYGKGYEIPKLKTLLDQITFP
jgi:integrase